MLDTERVHDKQQCITYSSVCWKPARRWAFIACSRLKDTMFIASSRCPIRDDFISTKSTRSSNPAPQQATHRIPRSTPAWSILSTQGQAAEDRTDQGRWKHSNHAATSAGQVGGGFPKYLLLSYNMLVRFTFRGGPQYTFRGNHRTVDPPGILATWIYCIFYFTALLLADLDVDIS